MPILSWFANFNHAKNAFWLKWITQKNPLYLNVSSFNSMKYMFSKKFENKSFETILSNPSQEYEK